MSRNYVKLQRNNEDDRRNELLQAENEELKIQICLCIL